MQDPTQQIRSREFPSRWRSIRTRLGLIAIGLLLGFLAKSVFPPADGTNREPLFAPMPSIPGEVEIDQ